NAMVCNWFTQVSFEPQHIVVSMEKSSYTYGLVAKSKQLAINIFDKSGADTIKNFSKSRAKNPDKFSSANYSDGPITGVPVIDEAVAFIECEVIDELDTGGRHALLLCKVVNAEVRKEGKSEETLTLLDIGWSYSG
ncbi:MAG: flavin reductase family protein, partial [Chloroflexota bacterium]